MDQWAKLFGYEGNVYYTFAITLLILARVLAILVLAPFLGGRLVPTQIKVTTALALSFVLFPVVRGTLTQPLPNMGPYFTLYLMKEAFIGITIGFVSSLVFQAIEAAGQYLDTARGSSIASVLVPQLEEQGPIFAQLKVQLAIAIFLTLNGHHLFLRGLFDSFIMLPVDVFPSLGMQNTAFIDYIIRATARVLVIGMQLVIPAMIALFLIDVVLGIANRAAPQLNVFFLGMPIKGYVGVLFALLALQYFTMLLTDQFRLMMRDIYAVMRLMSPQA